MNLKLIVSSVLDEMVFAMDGAGDRFGADAQGNAGWLEAHDRRFHGGHFDPETQSCGLRDRLQRQDNVDSIAAQGDANGNPRPIPLKAEFSALLGQAYGAGMLSHEDGDAIDELYRDVTNWMDSADESAELPQDIKDKMQALAEIEAALSAAMAEPVVNETTNERTTPTQGQVNRRSFPEQTGHLPENHPLSSFSYSDDALNANYTSLPVGPDGCRMPENFRNVNSVTPERVAALMGDLPVRGVFTLRHNHITRDRERCLNGVAFNEALRQMVVAPDSEIGQAMRRRYSEWFSTHNGSARQNGAFSRIRQAMELLGRNGYVGSQNNTASNASVNSSGNTSASNSNFVPQIQHTFTESNGSTEVRYTRPADVDAADEELARNKLGIGRSNGPLNFIGNSSGSNCFKNDIAGLIRDRGFDVIARGGGNDSTSDFAILKLAMSDSYEMVNKDNTEGTIANLERIRQTYPDGTWVSCWSGGHNTSLRLKGGKWYAYDVYGYYFHTNGNAGREVTSRDAVLGGTGNHYHSQICLPPRTVLGKEQTMSQLTGGLWASETQARALLRNNTFNDDEIDRIIKGKAKVEDIEKARRRGISPMVEAPKRWRMALNQARAECHRAGNMHPTEADLMAKMNERPLYYKANSTYVIKPTDKLIPEMFDMVRVR